MRNLSAVASATMMVHNFARRFPRAYIAYFTGLYEHHPLKNP
jgi:hypothetical protein